MLPQVTHSGRLSLFPRGLGQGVGWFVWLHVDLWIIYLKIIGDLLVQYLQIACKKEIKDLKLMPCVARTFFTFICLRTQEPSGCAAIVHMHDYSSILIKVCPCSLPRPSGFFWVSSETLHLWKCKHWTLETIFSNVFKFKTLQRASHCLTFIMTTSSCCYWGYLPGMCVLEKQKKPETNRGKFGWLEEPLVTEEELVCLLWVQTHKCICFFWPNLNPCACLSTYVIIAFLYLFLV